MCFLDYSVPSGNIIDENMKSLYVTGFWKTDQNVTLGLFHFIGPANAYIHTLRIHIRTAIIRLG